MDCSRRTTRSTYGSSTVGGRGRATPTARGRGRATPTARARGHGPTISMGRGRSSVSPTAHDNTLDREPSVEPVDTMTRVDPITQVIVNSVAPTAAYQAIQTLVGLFTGQQVQAGLTDETRMETIFDILGYSETQKGSLATYKLEGDAKHWWRMAKQKYKGKEHELIWSAFKKDFEDKYIPPAVKDQKRTAFLKLEQGNILVVEYQRKFDELSSPDSREGYSRGKECRESVQEVQSSGSGYPAKRVQTLSQTNEGVREASRPCFKCGKPHAAAFRCDGSPRICFTCGQAGHISTYCRAQVGGRNQAPQGQRQPVHGGGHNQR
ncbi:hypothetical protein Vadar_021476 [Vaccinium darrowii]|uniref:Uncharacterized protein n=1 Tax=Vaccinium darrowii TaxID=229202 RepID=A0ACB7X2R2_9ERIC|nr:hypothetical protein Vadar_021476 [Vaccinium darrowii]